MDICEEEYPYPYSIAACDHGAAGDHYYSLLLRPIENQLQPDKTYFIFGGAAHWLVFPSVFDMLIEDGSATLICLREILPFLLQNFTKAGACTLRLEEIQRAGFVPPQPQGKELTGTVAALRLDALAALAFRLSREEIKRCIAHGTLSCNHRQAEKGDVLLQPGDLLSLRGHGRARLLSVGGESRKGRLFVTFFVYL